jgi:hypothetical protein
MSAQFHIDMPSSIADRAKMRSRNTKSVAAVAIHAVSPRGRNSDKSNEVIELSSDEDELSLLPPPKSKGKGKGKGKAKKKSSANSAPSDSPLSSAPESDPEFLTKPKRKANKRSKISHPMSPYTQPTSQGTTPLPTSSLNDRMKPIPFHLLSSQLPPSDPPMSTATTCDLPPIETLPNLDTDPLSSPSSLFNAPMSERRKRKRVILGIDELDSDDHQGPEMDADARMMPPPPVPQPHVPGPSSAFVDSPHTAPNRSAESVDLSMIPSTAVRPVKKAKTTKSRKKKDEDHIMENGESGKAKPKGKGKEKKRKTVEVVIQMPKGKEKAKGKEKEVFKSREFIEDDDDEDEGLSVKASSRKVAALNKPSSMTSLSSVPGSDKEDIQAGPSKKRKSGIEQSAKGNIPTDEEDEPAPKRVTTRSKRQSKLLSEDEDEDPFVPSLGKVSPDRASNVNGKIKGKGSQSKKNPSSDDIVEPQSALKVSP